MLSPMKLSRDGTQIVKNNKAVLLNNKAVSLMNDGDYEDATLLLVQALTVSREVMIGGDPSTGAQEGSFCKKNASMAEFSLDKCMMQNPCIGDKAPEDNITGNQQIQENPYYIYRKAILIPCGELSSLEDFDSRILVSNIIVFNLALLYQLLAAKHHQINQQRPSEEEQQLLKKALKMYDLALKLHRQLENIDSPVFMMACVNNLGLSYQRLSESVMANRCFQHLLQTLMFLVDVRKQSGDVTMFDGFLRNATGQRCLHATAAAA